MIRILLQSPTKSRALETTKLASQRYTPSPPSRTADAGELLLLLSWRRFFFYCDTNCPNLEIVV